MEREHFATSYPDYLDWKAAQHSFEEIAVARRDDFNMTGNGEPERFSGLFVTASYFRVLKVPPMLGRTLFDEEDSVAGVNPVVLSEHLWRSRFAADPNIVGRKLSLNRISYEVVGVAAESLSILRNPETARNSQGARNADLYAPFGFYANRPYYHDRTNRGGFYGIARLKQGGLGPPEPAAVLEVDRPVAVDMPVDRGLAVDGHILVERRPPPLRREPIEASLRLVTCHLGSGASLDLRTVPLP